MNRIVEGSDHFIAICGLEIKFNFHLHDRSKVRNFQEDLLPSWEESCRTDFYLVVSGSRWFRDLVFL